MMTAVPESPYVRIFAGEYIFEQHNLTSITQVDEYTVDCLESSFIYGGTFSAQPMYFRTDKTVSPGRTYHYKINYIRNYARQYAAVRLYDANGVPVSDDIRGSEGTFTVPAGSGCTVYVGDYYVTNARIFGVGQLEITEV